MDIRSNITDALFNFFPPIFFLFFGWDSFYGSVFEFIDSFGISTLLLCPLTFLFQMCLLVLKFLFGFSHSEYVSAAISYLFFITCIFSVISVSIVLIAALNPLIIPTSESSWNGLHVWYFSLACGPHFPISWYVE